MMERNMIGFQAGAARILQYELVSPNLFNKTLNKKKMLSIK